MTTALELARYRTAMEMEGQGYKRAHVAKVLGCSVASVHVAVCRARKTLGSNVTWPRILPHTKRVPEPRPERIAPVVLPPEPVLPPPVAEPVAPAVPEPRPAPPRMSLKNMRAGAADYAPPVFEQTLVAPVEQEEQPEKEEEPRWELPRITHGALARIKTKEHLDQVWVAYDTPEVQFPANEGYVKRRAGTVELVVSEVDEVIVYVGEYVPSPELARKVLSPNHVKRKSSGGGKRGSVGPKTWADLRKALEEMGCEIDPNAAHYKVRGPNGVGQMTLPKTPSEYRGLENSIRDARLYLGVDLKAMKLVERIDTLTG